MLGIVRMLKSYLIAGCCPLVDIFLFGALRSITLARLDRKLTLRSSARRVRLLCAARLCKPVAYPNAKL